MGRVAAGENHPGNENMEFSFDFVLLRTRLLLQATEIF